MYSHLPSLHFSQPVMSISEQISATAAFACLVVGKIKRCGLLIHCLTTVSPPHILVYTRHSPILGISFAQISPSTLSGLQNQRGLDVGNLQYFATVHPGMFGIWPHRISVDSIIAWAGSSRSTHLSCVLSSAQSSRRAAATTENMASTSIIWNMALKPPCRNTRNSV